jgi:hypothetical protein
MSDELNDTLRRNGVTSELQRLLANSRKRVPAPPAGSSYKTLPDGRVLDRFGVEIYAPTAPAKAKL